MMMFRVLVGSKTFGRANKKESNIQKLCRGRTEKPKLTSSPPHREILRLEKKKKNSAILPLYFSVTFLFITIQVCIVCVCVCVSWPAQSTIWDRSFGAKVVIQRSLNQA